ncbi:hypothetical protein JKP88DRAFT_289271 [Tribonema minus]|uniref:Uncharacterized protein n=1 Tax=Tribonema minus TaxID=303371 RepID=A0A836CHJ4_9STRA|nr:hypothetical protein JKP88DRAFT_289271 [Tribonema minus]
MLETTEQVTLSALEGAIVSGVDAAFLLERSQVATITEVRTDLATVTARAPHGAEAPASSQWRARMQITLTRTPQYQQFLLDEAGAEAAEEAAAEVAQEFAEEIAVMPGDAEVTGAAAAAAAGEGVAEAADATVPICAVTGEGKPDVADSYGFAATPIAFEPSEM